MLGDFGVFVMHRILTWITWSLTRVCDLFCVRMHTHGGPRFIVSSVGLWTFCWRLDFSILLTVWVWSLQDERRGQTTRTWEEEEEEKKLTVLFCRHWLTLQSRGTAALVTVIWRTHLNWHLFSFSEFRAVSQLLWHGTLTLTLSRVVDANLKRFQSPPMLRWFIHFSQRLAVTD